MVFGCRTPETTISSLYCARCGLRTQLTPASLLLENCPRCLARSGTVTPLTVSPSPRPARARPEPEAAQAKAPHPGS